jgi:hypothetical protein
MAELVHPVPIRALDADGNPVAAAELYAYRKGTSTPLTIYADSAGASAHPSPLVADSDGVFAAIYNTSSYDVKIDVQDPVTNVSLPGYPLDPAITSNDGAIAAADVTFSATTEINQTDVQAAIEQVDANWRAAKTGVDDDIVSGTAGTAGNLAQWNADGDLVDGPDFLDEDDFASNSATAAPSQQSTKAYVDAAVAASGSTTPGWNLLGTLDTATGTPASVSLTSLDLTDYNYIMAVFDAVVHSGSGGTGQFESQTYCGTLSGNPTTTYGFIQCDLNTGVAVCHIEAAGQEGVSVIVNTSLSKASTSVTFSRSVNDYAGGEIKVYGVV